MTVANIEAEYQADLLHHLLRDIHLEYLHQGHSGSLYALMSEFFEQLTRCLREVGVTPTVEHRVKQLMDVLYRIEVDRIEGWSDFVAAATQARAEQLLDIVVRRNHRVPPKPGWFYVAVRGYCRYCGKQILRTDGLVDRRRAWHDDCARQFRLIHWPAECRKAVYRRDRGRCAECGVRDPAWEMDHRRPLIESNGDIAFWTMGNIQTLCGIHHRTKTAAENSARWAQRREDAHG